ncbi:MULTISPECIES: hypothetical protein [unclassified Coleofasciculus]|nr:MULTISPECIES: hypothetical protein [unclassified Coleofasciculus]
MVLPLKTTVTDYIQTPASENVVEVISYLRSVAVYTLNVERYL